MSNSYIIQSLVNALFGVVYPYLHIAYPWLDLLDIKCYHCYLKGNDYTHNSQLRN